MKPSARCLALLVGLGCATGGTPPRSSLPVPTGGAPARVVLVSVAGLTPAVYGAGDGRSMPWLRALAVAGVEAEAVAPVAPSDVYPAHATLITGELPARHGVPANQLLGEAGVRAATYSHASFVRVPTLWQRAREARLPVASFDWPTTVGAAIDLLLPDVVPVRRDQSWVELLEDTATPALVERVRATGPGDVPGPERDRLLVGLACEALGSSVAPRLVLLRLSQSEAPLARFGPGSAEARAAFASIDRELGRLLDCLRAAGRLEDGALVVVGDRGFLPVHTRVNPNRALGEAGLLSQAGASSWKAIVRTNGGSAFVYASDENSAIRARSVLEDLAERTRAFRVVSAQEMLDVGGDPEAWFALEATPGVVFADGEGRALVEPAARRGASGYLPDDAELYPGFVAWGRGLRRGVRIPWMRQSDVAPTLAALLGLELAPRDGRALVGVLDLQGTPPVGTRPGR
ncbi:MAG: alkaline phosphatase family protein [Myxococcota bacterium]